MCIAPHIIHSSIWPMKQTSHWLIIRLSGQSGCGRQKRSCKEILFFSLPVFCLLYILDQAIKCCDSLNPSPPLPFPSPKLKQSSCWWDRRLWAAPLPLENSQLTTPNIWRVAPKDLENILSIYKKTSQELRMLSRSPSDCRSLLLNLNLNRCLCSDCSDCSDCSAIVVLL